MREIGLAFFAFIPIYLGYQKRFRILTRGKTKQAAILFFENLRFEIEHFSRSQNEIFARFDNARLERFGFLPLLRREAENDPCGALKRAIEAFRQENIFGEKEWESLELFCENFGMQSKRTQLEDCDRLLLVLKKSEDGADEKRKSDASVAVACGLCIGIGLFILFL